MKIGQRFRFAKKLSDHFIWHFTVIFPVSSSDFFESLSLKIWKKKVFLCFFVMNKMCKKDFVSYTHMHTFISFFVFYKVNTSFGKCYHDKEKIIRYLLFLSKTAVDFEIVCNSTHMFTTIHFFSSRHIQKHVLNFHQVDSLLFLLLFLIL